MADLSLGRSLNVLTTGGALEGGRSRDKTLNVWALLRGKGLDKNYFKSCLIH